MTSGHDHDNGHEPESHILPDLLADLNFSTSTSMLPGSSTSQWQAAPSSSRTSPALLPGRPTSLFPGRTSSHRLSTQAVSDLDVAGSQAGPSASQMPSLFANPNRSIFSSGLPTASVSANTAHASMSSPPNPSSGHPLSALTAPSLAITKRPVQQSETASPSRKTRFTAVEKDADDPSCAMDETGRGKRRGVSTPVALSNIFAAPTEPTSPTFSRHDSYFRTPSGTQYIKAMSNETAPLPSHLYREGLLSGRHSDITIHAFGSRYPLHRLLLDRAPFFRSAFSAPWHESTAKEITLHPEDIDTNITKTAFELALKRIYGCNTLEEEDKEAIALFATGCWLEMLDLIESSVNSILKQMTAANISKSIQLVTHNYYGKHGDRILAAAKAMLCREGWEMPLRNYDGISGEIVREILGCDGFYVPTEWNRFVTAKRILNRRLKAVAIEAGLINARGEPIVQMPDSLKFMSIRFDAVYRSTFTPGTGSATGPSDRWLAVYTMPDIAPLLVLLDEGIHYMHLNFEQLQRIRETRDILGLPLIPEKVISNALWTSLELRQHVVNATENQLELGLSHEVEEPAEEETEDNLVEEMTESFNMTFSERSQGKRKLEDDEDPDDDEMDSGSWDGNGKPRKFWIPMADATFPLGGDLEPIASQSPPSTSHGHRSRISAVLDPQDLQWATDFGSTAQERPTTPVVSNAPSPEVTYTHYPPFRFAVEFPPTRSLKENKRVYSSTVWYAGSLWNVYVQKKETGKGTQLGIYLHRERQVDGNGELLADILHNSVNERIGHLEREALLGRTSRRNVQDQIYSSEDGGDTTLIGGPTSADLDTLSGVLRQGTAGPTKSSQASLTPHATRRFGDDTPRTEDEREDTRANEKKYRTATLPPYVDARPTVKTYFKIYTPSKGGRQLSVYESAPDKFNFSQSWGWKSSNLVVDDSISTVEGTRKEPRLRFMVVIGNV